MANTNQLSRLRNAGSMGQWLDQPLPAVYENDPLQVSVQFKDSGLHFLRAQVDRDLQAWSVGHDIAGLDYLNLLDVEIMLIRHMDHEPLGGGDNLVINYDQLKLLLKYVSWHCDQALDIEDNLSLDALCDGLYALTLGLTLLTPFYLPTYDRVFYLSHSLGLVRYWIRTFFSGYRHGQSFSVLQEGC